MSTRSIRTAPQPLQRLWQRCQGRREHTWSTMFKEILTPHGCIDVALLQTAIPRASGLGTLGHQVPSDVGPPARVPRGPHDQTRQVVDPRGTQKGKTMGAKAFPNKWRRRGWQTFCCRPAVWGVFRRTLATGRGLRVGRRFPAHFDAASFPRKHQNQNSEKGHNSELIFNEFGSFLFTMVPSPPPPGHFRMHPPRKRKQTQFVLFFSLRRSVWVCGGVNK
jgi:hypothetical protein